MNKSVAIAVLFCLTSFTGCIGDDELQQQIEDVEEEQIAATGDSEELSQQLASLAANYSKLAADLVEMNTNLEKALVNTQQLAGELADAEAALAVANEKSNTSEFEKKISNLEEDLQEAMADLQSAKANLETAESDLSKANQNLDEGEADYQSLNDEFEKLEGNYTDLKQDYADLELDYDNLKADFDEWKTYQSITVWNIEGDCPTTLHFSYASGIDNGDGEGEAGNGKLENGEIDTEATVCVPGTNSINTGSSSYYIYEITEFDNRLYFRYQDSTYGSEMWVSDGVNMEMFMDINPGDDHSYATPVTVVGSLLYFRADNGIHGTELWATDGTKDGTYMIKDIIPGTDGTYSSYYETLKDKLYFDTYTSDYGRELWVTDGTEDGTHMVKDIYPGDDSSSPSSLTEWNGSLYFAAYTADYGKELWVSDGTEDGTHMVKDIYPGENSGAYGCSSPMPHECEGHKMLTEYNGKAYFSASDGEHGSEPWVTDGTKNGTVMVKDIRPGESSSLYCSIGYSFSSCFFEYNELLFFQASDGEHGHELWRTDGTEDGTLMFADISDGSDSSYPYNFFVLNDYFYFSADDGSNNDIWMTDGKQMLMSLEIYPNQYLSFNNLIHFAGEVYFRCTCSSGDGSEFWKTDGTKEGTVMVYDIRPGTSSSSPAYFTIYRDALFFRAYNSSGYEELYVHSPDYWEF